MKALSIQQPWSWLIANGHKDIENRTWKANVRGRIAIHAGKEIDKDYWLIKAECAERGIEIPDWQDLETGGIVGTVDILDCVTESTSPWWQDSSKYGFVLANAKPCEFFAFRGKLSFFDTPFYLP